MDNAVPRPETTSQMERILYEVKKIVVGQDHFLERVLVAILAQGHLLVEGVPGLAKTLTVKTLATTLRGSFRRIQFTPDLVPADLVGTRIYNQRTGEFSTSLGPVFTQPAARRRDQPRAGEGAKRAARSDAGAPGHDRRRDAQGARAVSGDGDAEPDRDRRHLSAARSAGRPLHDEGAGRLPERGAGVRHRAARDRQRRSTVGTVATPEQLLALQRECRSSYVDPSLIQYAVRLVAATRDPGSAGLADLKRYINFGASPRASIHLIEGARALAFLRGRAYVLPEDVVDLVPDVLRHRLVLSYEALADGQTADALIHRILAQLPAPDKPLEAHLKVAAPA